MLREHNEGFLCNLQGFFFTQNQFFTEISGWIAKLLETAFYSHNFQRSINLFETQNKSKNFNCLGNNKTERKKNNISHQKTYQRPTELLARCAKK